jgi:hypothetical protein
MASIAIPSSAPSSVTPAAASARVAPAQSETSAKPAPVLREDTVKLSPASQARLLHREGQSVAVIAASLGTNVSSIDGYLNIKAAVAASPEAAAPVAAAQPEKSDTPTAKPAEEPQAHE